eukprot:748215_1
MTSLDLLTELIDTIQKLSIYSRDHRTYTVIQDTWNEEEDQELLNYFQEMNIIVKVLCATDILKQNPLNIDVLFADTAIVQQMIPPRIVPDTYPLCFKDLYHRKIQKVQFGECLREKKHFFIKPCSNDKSFYATKVIQDCDLKCLSDNDDMRPWDYVYCCELVQFVNEYRLFICNHTLFAMQESSHYILPSNTIQTKDPPRDLIAQILNMNPFSHCVIDVGMLDNGQWALVEVNPLFALSSYGLNVAKYFDYCISAWTMIKGCVREDRKGKKVASDSKV